MAVSKYQVFQTVVEVGSLTRAAQLLAMTQSGVSHAIANLESELGFTLLNRDRSGIRLTSNGERILACVREILRWEERLQQQAAAINQLEVGTVRIGTFRTVSTQWLPSILKVFQAAHPSLEIKLYEGVYEDIDAWLADGSIDFGFVSLPTAKPMEHIPLKKDKMLCVLPEDHALAAQATISFADIAAQSFIMPKWGPGNDVWRTLQENKIVPAVKYEVAEDQAIIAMVENGLGISILPEMVLFRMNGNLLAKELERVHYRTIGIAVPDMEQLSPAAQMFITCTKEWLEAQGLLDFA